MAFSIRLTEEEKSLADSYAKLNSMSLGEAFKKALFEKIEDEYDLEICKEYLKAKEEGKLVTIPFEEAAKEWDLE